MAECLICLGDLDVYKYHIRCLNCKQKFHKGCHLKWRNLQNFQNQLLIKCVHCQTVGLQSSYIKRRIPTVKERFLKWCIGI